MPYYVYITTNRNHTVLYTGVTGDLPKRVAEHKMKLKAGFTSRYRVDRLVFYEGYDDLGTAIAREKQIKGGSRQRKIELILKKNRYWKDLSGSL